MEAFCPVEALRPPAPASCRQEPRGLGLARRALGPSARGGHPRGVPTLARASVGRGPLAQRPGRRTWCRASSGASRAPGDNAHEMQGSVQRNDAADSGPLVKPHPQMSPEEAVEAQLGALAACDEPRPDHGLEVMYYFANAEGTLSPGAASAASGDVLPRYFGCAADLYHFGHFALKFRTRFPQLINHTGFEIRSVTPYGSGEGELAVIENEKPLGMVLCRVVVNVSPQRKKASRGFSGSSSAAESPDAPVQESWEIGLAQVVRGINPPCWLTNFIRRAA